MSESIHHFPSEVIEEECTKGGVAGTYLLNDVDGSTMSRESQQQWEGRWTCGGGEGGRTYQRRWGRGNRGSYLYPGADLGGGGGGGGGGEGAGGMCPPPLPLRSSNYIFMLRNRTYRVTADVNV